ncbi:ABC transporter substrate-binding protein [Yinghuangia soli]|uniref:ABC transporter substrate-binding protein n=1 Tax=Yinghuangia soli TaxID=2908204 RepID=A0AA41U1H4_9ACTN|nr:ABC transporter substrate-binding protein [Yinghuangia soli]MCF2526139.1 ABC transporter substrate-binding protein [Yinghuangia soli]
MRPGARRRLALAGAALLLLATTATTAACTPDGGGRSVTVLGTWTGAEAAAFEDVVAPFERRTGIDVRYEGTRDVDAVLAARVEDGTPPDLAALSSPGDLIRYARNGRLVALDGIPGLAESDKAYAADWVTLGRVDDVRVAVVVKAALKSLVWYDPKTLAAHNLRPPRTWQELTASAAKLAEQGVAPWCLGLASSSASGWPGTDWIEDIVLARSGPEVYDRWTDGRLPWTAPEIRAAWQTWGELLGIGRAGGGDGPGTGAGAGAGSGAGTGSGTGSGNAAMSALLTRYDQAGAGLVADPPRCGLEHQASFAAAWYEGAPNKPLPGVDFSFAPFPVFTDSQGAARPGPEVREVAGDVMAMFDDTDEARELIAYLAGTEAQTLWVREGAMSPNRGVPVDAYPSHPVAQALGRALAEAEAIRFDASDRMPAPMRGAFHRAVLAYIADPSDLDAILADLDQARIAAYP